MHCILQIASYVPVGYLRLLGEAVDALNAQPPLPLSDIPALSLMLKSFPCAVCTLVLDLLLHDFDATTVTALTSTDP